MPTPALNLKFLSHGTLPSKNLEATREFYTEFLGLEVIRTSKISLMIRLGSDHVYAVVENRQYNTDMHRLFHNGLDVSSDAEVDQAYQVTCDQAHKWDLTKITKPKTQHGTYSFHFWDRDGNCWEILSNPDRGYFWIFDQGDQEGRGTWGADFERPTNGN